MPNNDNNNDNNDNNLELEAKKLQYQRASEDLRYFASLTWKLPSISLAIVSAAIAISSRLINQPVHNGLVIIAGILLVGFMMLITGKYRLFEVKSATVLKMLERDFQNFTNKDTRKVWYMPVETAESKKCNEDWEKDHPLIKMSRIDRFRYARAFHLLLLLMISYIGLLFYISYMECYFPFINGTYNPNC